MTRSRFFVFCALAPVGAFAAGSAVAFVGAPTASASTPPVTTLVDGVLKNMATMPAIEISGATGGLKIQEDFLPKEHEAYVSESGSGNGYTMSFESLVSGKVAYVKANLVALELFGTVSGNVPTKKLAPYTNKWLIVQQAHGSDLVAGDTATMAGLGRLLCNPLSTSATATVNGKSTTASTGGCSLSGTTVASYSPSKAVISSKGLGNETVTFTRVDGKLLPTAITSNGSQSTSTNGSTSASASSGKRTMTFAYPSSAPSLPTPTGATKLPAILASL